MTDGKSFFTFFNISDGLTLLVDYEFSLRSEIISSERFFYILSMRVPCLEFGPKLSSPEVLLSYLGVFNYPYS